MYNCPLLISWQGWIFWHYSANPVAEQFWVFGTFRKSFFRKKDNFFQQKTFPKLFSMENFSEKLNKTKTAIKKFPRFMQLHIHNIPGYVCLVYLVFSFLIRCCVCLVYLVANFSIWCDHLQILHHAIQCKVTLVNFL